METGTIKSRCIKCDREKRAVRCEGCLQLFCYDHLTDHRQELNKQLDYIEHTRDVFRQTLNEQMNHSQMSLFMKQIDQWEEDSVKVVRHTALEYRQVLIQHTAKNIHQIEVNLASLSDHLRRIRQENDFNEIDLNLFNQRLKQLAEKLNNISHVSLQQDLTPLVHKLSIVVSPESVSSTSSTPINNRWKQYGSTIAGVNYPGSQPNQLSNPLGIYVDDEEPLVCYIADYGNHRIVKWRYGTSHGEVVAGGNGQGDRIDQLSFPTDVIYDDVSDSLIICDQGNQRVVRWPCQCDATPQIIIANIICWGLAMDNNGNLYVSDYEKDEIIRWTKGDTSGVIVAGGKGRGDNLNQLNYPSYIFVDQEYSVYVSDSNNNRVMKWVKGAKEGVVVAGGQGKGNNLAQLSNPQGVIVGQSGNIYVADSWNHRIMRWSPDATMGSIVVGGNGQGPQPNQFNCPLGLSFDRQGNLCVVDWGNNRVQKFDVDID